MTNQPDTPHGPRRVHQPADPRPLFRPTPDGRFDWRAWNRDLAAMAARENSTPGQRAVRTLEALCQRASELPGASPCE